MPASSPLNIAVLGVGSIGSAFAFQLLRIGGHDVTAIARPGSTRLEQLRRDGGIVNIEGERATVRVADALDEQTPYDLIIVTTLAHQVDAVLPALQRSAAKCIQFMFNTFEPERLRDAVGLERCSFGMPFVQAQLKDDGKLKAIIGAMGRKTLVGQQRWVDLFNEAGMPAALEQHMPLWLRCHVPLCIAFESVSVAGQRRGGGASWGEAVTVARGVRESFALIEALGHPLYPSTKARLNGCPAWVLASMLWSMSRIRSFRELLATGETECCALIDVLLAAAHASEPPIRSSGIGAMRPSEATSIGQDRAAVSRLAASSPPSRAFPSIGMEPSHSDGQSGAEE